MPIITVAVCTFDRYPLLEAALQSLACQSLSADAFEIVVIDNSPDAAKAEAYARGEAAPPRLRFLREKTPGLSNARNAALAACRTPLLAFMDDDAVARPDWLEQLLHAFDELGPETAMIGGKVELTWRVPRPAWLADGLLTWLSAVDRGPFRRELRAGEWLAGANIAFRREALAATGGFSPLLGRYGESAVLLSNDEIFIMNRIRSLGGRVYYEPGAVVEHLAHPERLTRAWFRRRIAWQAVSDAIMKALHPAQDAAIGADAAILRSRSLAELGDDTDDPEAFTRQLRDIEVLLGALMTAGTLPGRLAEAEAQPWPEHGRAAAS